jgi:hypothetical protein
MHNNLMDHQIRGVAHNDRHILELIWVYDLKWIQILALEGLRSYWACIHISLLRISRPVHDGVIEVIILMSMYMSQLECCLGLVFWMGRGRSPVCFEFSSYLRIKSEVTLPDDMYILCQTRRYGLICYFAL